MLTLTSLWKATRKLRHTREHVLPIAKTDGRWTRTDMETYTDT